jgi:hypothetical protein
MALAVSLTVFPLAIALALITAHAPWLGNRALPTVVLT